MLDRIDLVCEMGQPPPPVFAADAPRPEGSAEVRERVLAARALQTRRLGPEGIACNAAMDARATRRAVRVEEPSVAAALERLSGRGQDRVLRLARTIADLHESAEVGREHLDEALGYRMTDPLRVAA